MLDLEAGIAAERVERVIETSVGSASGFSPFFEDFGPLEAFEEDGAPLEGRDDDGPPALGRALDPPRFLFSGATEFPFARRDSIEF